MTVGELSRRTGTPTRALRAWTDMGLVYSAGRSPAEYRLYDESAQVKSWLVPGERPSVMSRRLPDFLARVEHVARQDEATVDGLLVAVQEPHAEDRWRNWPGLSRGGRGQARDLEGLIYGIYR